MFLFKHEFRSFFLLLGLRPTDNKKLIAHMRRDCLYEIRCQRRETNILAADRVIAGFLASGSSAGGSSPLRFKANSAGGSSALRFKADRLAVPAGDDAGSPWARAITTYS